MAEMVNPARHEFWRPPSPGTVIQDHSNTCQECRTEFIVGSRYCHCCGASRTGLGSGEAPPIPGVAEMTALGKRLGLAMPPLIAFVIGALCLLAAISVSVLFTARTALDWQAIQLWRIEWLLAGIAGFAAGLLLKKIA